MTLALPTVVSAKAADLHSHQHYDAVIALYPTLCSELTSTFKSLATYSSVDKNFGSSLTLIPDQTVAGGRLILAPIGSLTGDSDDVRKFQEASKAAMKRAMAAGSVSPLFYFPGSVAHSIKGHESEEDYSHFVEVSVLGALAASFDPIDVREHYKKVKEDHYKVKTIGVLAVGAELTKERLAFVNAVEIGRRVAKDLGSPNCERMTPIKFAEYVEAYFKTQSNIKVSVIEDVDYMEKEYPLLHAVARCSLS
ncbi:hypothetical protein BGZ83_005971, partial [Gryganskiella cystojenkinii]